MLQIDLLHFLVLLSPFLNNIHNFMNDSAEADSTIGFLLIEFSMVGSTGR